MLLKRQQEAVYRNVRTKAIYLDEETRTFTLQGAVHRLDSYQAVLRYKGIQHTFLLHQCVNLENPAITIEPTKDEVLHRFCMDVLSYQFSPTYEKFCADYQLHSEADNWAASFFERCKQAAYFVDTYFQKEFALLVKYYFPLKTDTNDAERIYARM